MDQQHPIRVCVFGPNGQWRPSMDRFAGDLVAARGDRVTIWDASIGRGSSNEVSARVEWMRRWIIQPAAAHRERADVFHITDHSYAQIALGLPRDRTVITCHDLIPLRAAEKDLGFTLSKRQLAQYRLSVRFLKRAKQIVAVSATTREDITRYLGIPESRIEVIPQGVASHFIPLPEQVRLHQRAMLGITSQFILVHVGATPYKNSETVVRVLADLVRCGIDVLLMQVGMSWPEKTTLLARNLRVADRIRPLGRISDEDMVKTLNAADAMFFPSFWEGFGYPVAEAMSCGLAVVTSDTPALRELTGRDGLAAGAKDIEGFARHLERLATDLNFRANVARAGRERSQKFRLSHTRDQYLSLYESMAGRSRGLP